MLIRTYLLANLIGLFVLVGFYLPISAFASVVDVKASHGAMGDGVTNDTAAINAAITAACSSGGGNSLFFPNGSYLVDELNSINDCSITLYGNSSSTVTLVLASDKGAVHSQMIMFKGATSTLNIHDISFRGQNKNATGISVVGADTVTFQNISVKNFGVPGYSAGHNLSNDGAYLLAVGTGTISHSEFIGNERYGVEGQAVHDFKISYSNLSYNGSLGAVAEQRRDGQSDGPLTVLFEYNIVEGTGGGGFDIETANGLNPTFGRIENNTIKNCGNDQWGYGWGIVLGNNTYGNITGNTISNFSSITGPAAYRKALVWGKTIGQVLINSNTVTGGIVGIGTGDGNGATSTTISNNVIGDNVTGILGYNAPKTVITGNTIYNSSSYGVNFDLSSSLNITGNTFYGNAVPIYTTRSFSLTTSPNVYPKVITEFRLSNPNIVGTINESTHEITLNVPFGTDVASLMPVYSYHGSSSSPLSSTTHSFVSGVPVPYTIKADDGSTQVYVVTVNVALNPAKTINTFNIVNPSIAGIVDETAKTVSLNVPYGTRLDNIVTLYTFTGTSSSPASGELQAFTDGVAKPFTITAADGTTQIYLVTINVAKQASTVSGSFSINCFYSCLSKKVTADEIKFDATISNINKKNVIHFSVSTSTPFIILSKVPSFASSTIIFATSTFEWKDKTAQVIYIKSCNAKAECSNPVTLQIQAQVFTGFNKDLYLGMKDSDVIKLQKYLNSKGFVIAKTGPGSKGKESNYFGIATKNALIKFQKANKIKIGKIESFGYLGLSTRNYINSK